MIVVALILSCGCADGLVVIGVVVLLLFFVVGDGVAAASFVNAVTGFLNCHVRLLHTTETILLGFPFSLLLSFDI